MEKQIGHHVNGLAKRIMDEEYVNKRTAGQIKGGERAGGRRDEGLKFKKNIFIAKLCEHNNESADPEACDLFPCDTRTTTCKVCTFRHDKVVTASHRHSESI